MANVVIIKNICKGIFGDFLATFMKINDIVMFSKRFSHIYNERIFSLLWVCLMVVCIHTYL